MDLECVPILSYGVLRKLCGKFHSCVKVFYIFIILEFCSRTADKILRCLLNIWKKHCFQSRKKLEVDYIIKITRRQMLRTVFRKEKKKP